MSDGAGTIHYMTVPECDGVGPTDWLAGQVLLTAGFRSSVPDGSRVKRRGPSLSRGISGDCLS